MISFEKYIPKPKIFYGYFDVMKSLNYIEDIEIMDDEQGGDPVIKIIRHKQEIQKHII